MQLIYTVPLLQGRKLAYREQRSPHDEQRVVARAACTALASTVPAASDLPSPCAAAAPFGPWAC